jgi:AmmeMemoRadiSam system protein B
MTETLPRLRPDLDVMPSPVEEQPGLMLRDPFLYTPSVLVIPPMLIPALAFLDGEKTGAELEEFLHARHGKHAAQGLGEHIVATLREQGFLVTDEFFAMRDARHEDFRGMTERRPAYAGSAYPDEVDQLRQKFAGYLADAPVLRDHSTGNGASKLPNGLIGLAAPHVSPGGGWRSYGAAYSRLPGVPADKTFVVLGTSHYGEPEKFGLTHKPFLTPYGSLPVDTALVDWIERRAPDVVIMEDYCHAVEHSIEFQCVFLQHVFGPSVRILPILCGSYWESLKTGKPPESNASIERFLDTLGELAEMEASRLFWILGVDMAHIGQRYGDEDAVRAGEGRMEEVQARDLARLDRICAGDPEGFFGLVHPDQDSLRWCGYSAYYTFLKALPKMRGQTLHYEQWNIDEESVVSFSAMEFVRDSAESDDVSGNTSGESPGNICSDRKPE